MPIRDLAAQVRSLRNDYGDSHGPHAPASFEVALFAGDPNDDGEEITSTTQLVDEDSGAVTTVGNGYARIAVANDATTFPAPDPATGILTTPVLDFPAATAEYPETVTHWLLLDAATGDGWDTGVLPRDEQITVEGAGVRPRLALSLFYSGVSA